jgi:pyruvate/2-oxoglutarate dehydrogenase complex dihydrolipoamide acyltransferase (E2) component
MGNFGRVMPDDVLKATGKYVPPKSAAVVAASAAAASTTATTASTVSAAATGSGKVLEGLVPMDGMQKAVAKNMEKTLSVPVFRVSRHTLTLLLLQFLFI